MQALPEAADADLKSTVVVIPFQGRKVRHLAGVFYDSTRAETTFCGQPTKAMSREPAETVFDQQRDCQNCAREFSGATVSTVTTERSEGFGHGTLSPANHASTTL